MISIRYCSFASEISAALRRPKASSGKWSKTGTGGEVGGGFRRNLCRTHRRTTRFPHAECGLCPGYLLTHRARQVRLRDFEEFDRIVAMDDTNYHNLYRLAPSREAGNRIYRMSEFSGNIRTGPMCQTPTTKGMKGSSWCSICSRTAAARCSTSWRRGSSKSQRTKKSAFFNALFFVESSLYAGAIRNIWSVERPNQK